MTYIKTIWKTYCCDDTVKCNAVTEAHPALVVRIFSLPQEVLMPYVVGMFTEHPAASFHLDRVAVFEVGTQSGWSVVASQEQPSKSLSSKKVSCNKSKVSPVTLESI